MEIGLARRMAGESSGESGKRITEKTEKDEELGLMRDSGVAHQRAARDIFSPDSPFWCRASAFDVQLAVAHRQGAEDQRGRGADGILSSAIHNLKCCGRVLGIRRR